MSGCGRCIFNPFCQSAWAVCSSFKDKENFVEIVRCKECNQCYHNPSLGTYRCGRFMAIVNPNDFCSYGSRENLIMIDKELKPCPKYNNNLCRVVVVKTMANKYRVGCTIHNVWQPHGFDTVEEAVEAWNRSADDDRREADY